MAHIGPHGETYPTKATKEQIFRQEAVVPSAKWEGTVGGGPKAIVEVLRALASRIEQCADLDLFYTYPPWGADAPPPQRITSRLVHVDLHCCVQEPPVPHWDDYLYENYKASVTARLGFE